MTPEEYLEKQTAANTPETPEQELSKEIEKRDKINEIIAQQNAEKSESEKKITALEKEVSDVTKVVEAYKKEYENIKKEKTVLDEYYHNMYPKIEEIVIAQDIKEDINKKIRDFDTETDSIKRSMIEGEVLWKEGPGALWNKYKKAKTDFDTALKALTDAQSEYDTLKKRQNEIAENLKDIQNLKSMIDKSDEAIDAGKRYFWITEIGNILTTLPDKIISPDVPPGDLKSSLYNKYDVVQEKNTEFMEKDKALKVAKNDCESKRKLWESRVKNRRDEILQEINEILKKNK